MQILKRLFLPPIAGLVFFLEVMLFILPMLYYWIRWVTTGKEHDILYGGYAPGDIADWIMKKVV